MHPLNIKLLKNAAKKAGILLSPEQLGAFDMFGDLLTERNHYVNLTAIKDERDVIVKHFLDSLFPAARVRELAALSRTDYITGGMNSNLSSICRPVPDAPPLFARPENTARLIDVGAGAGFPGIPLKILFGGAIDVTLIDSTKKKVDFINSVIAKLNLRGCAALHIRAEDAARHGEFKGRFAFVTARAVAPLPKLLEYCMPFIEPGGVFIAMKGRLAAAEQELRQSEQALRRLGAAPIRIIQYRLETPPDTLSLHTQPDAACADACGLCGSRLPDVAINTSQPAISADAATCDTFSQFTPLDAACADASLPTVSPNADFTSESYERTLIILKNVK